MTQPLLADELEHAAGLLAGARHLLALTGAGLSVDSGIPPFRGPGGLWTKHGEPPMNGFERFLADPAQAWRERLSPNGPRSEIWKTLREARPNAGHMALVRLERAELLRWIITQNVDNLHTAAGSRRVAEIHGNATLVRCLHCSERRPLSETPIEHLPPLCARCGGILKSDTVSFGEPIPLDVLAVCEEQSEACDCMLVVGTSATVFPAAQFALDVPIRGGTLVEVNLYASELTPRCAVSLRGSAAEILPSLVDRVLKRRSSNA